MDSWALRLTWLKGPSLRSIDDVAPESHIQYKISPVDLVADRLKPMKTGDIFRDHPIAMKNHLGPLLLCAAALNFAVGCSNPYSAHPLSRASFSLENSQRSASRHHPEG
jgi:hypothetical protein